MPDRARSASGRWFQPAEANRDAAVRLFLFPHAGSGASAFREWLRVLPPDIAYRAVQLPGRQDRMDEAACTDIDWLVGALLEAFDAEADDRPYAFFGHCLGALVCYRLALAIERHGGPGPVLIAASGWAPSGFHSVEIQFVRMPDRQLLDWIRVLGTVPRPVMDDKDMMEMIMPVMRADLSLVAGYVDDGAKVSCPVVSYSGKQDQLVEPDDMSAWTTRTPSYLGHRAFQGDHFYLDRNLTEVTADLVRHIRWSARTG